jgi:adenine phosphoribosyltransferase
VIELKKFIRDVPDFPKPGILFRDITPLLDSPSAFAAAVEAMTLPFRDKKIDKICAIEARGFVFGAVIARELSAGFVPIRKPGKLPRDAVRVSYELEYSQSVLEIHRDALRPGDRTLVVDDVLATGGTAAAAVRLVSELGATVVGLTFLIELPLLDGRNQLTGMKVESAVRL